jgi:hypothetical protein
MPLQAAEDVLFTKVSTPAGPVANSFTPRAPRPPMIVDTPGGPVFVEERKYICACPPRSWACGC